MKIIVMSDTHLNRVSDEFQAICTRYCDDADLVIHLGDWVASSVLDYLSQYPLEAVAGNMDNHIIHDHLPPKKVIRVEGRRIGIIHGWGSTTNLRSRLVREFSDVDAILFGHTHEPLQLEENGIFWFNPGSVFTGRGHPPRTLGILNFDGHFQSEIVTL
jgi:uncharacterized protein